MVFHVESDVHAFLLARYLPEAAQRLLLRAVDQTLNCQVSEMDEKLLLNPYNKQAAGLPRMLPYKACLQRMAVQQRTHAGKQCMDLLHTACTHSSIVAVRSSQFPVYLLKTLLANNPALKIIYYISHPREIIKYQTKRRSRRASSSTNNLCMKLIQDYVHLRNLNVTFRDNLKLVHDEDLLSDLVQTANELYSFLGMSLPAEVERWVNASTAAATWRTLSASRQDSNTTPEVTIYESNNGCDLAASLLGYANSP